MCVARSTTVCVDAIAQNLNALSHNIEDFFFANRIKRLSSKQQQHVNVKYKKKIREKEEDLQAEILR